jgi:hypothetical protein
MSNFQADFSESTNALQLTCPVEGIVKRFELHAYTEGDDMLSNTAADNERGMVGVWHAPEPYPDKLDARTRYKIEGLEGLQRFFKEAQASDGAQFGLLDLRSDKSYRSHATIGRWTRSGSTLKLMADGAELDLTISSDGSKLYGGGKVLFVRN